MTEAQRRAKVVEESLNGTTLSEAAALAKWPWPDFEKTWNQGRSEHEASAATTLARWVADVRAARAACRKTLRLQVLDDPDSRGNKTRLDLLLKLEADVEPADLVADSPLDHLWAWSMSDAERDACRRILKGHKVDVDALVSSSGDWRREGAEAAAVDHEEAAAA